MSTTRTPRRAARGFTLLEIIVVVAIMAMLAGAAIPIASKALTSAARKSTREEVTQIGAAAQEYFRDTLKAPGKIRDLEVTSGVAGWTGPYLPGALTDPLATTSGYTTDAWSRNYKVSLSGDAWTVQSPGADADFDGDDDITLEVDFTLVRREKTIEELKTVNQAITLYNGVYGATKPLSITWKTALTALVDKGFLPDYDTYLADAWSKDYVPDPLGKSPLVKVTSTMLTSGAGAGGGGSGDDKGKGKGKDDDKGKKDGDDDKDNGKGNNGKGGKDGKKD